MSFPENFGILQVVSRFYEYEDILPKVGRCTEVRGACERVVLNAFPHHQEAALNRQGPGDALWVLMVRPPASL